MLEKKEAGGWKDKPEENRVNAKKEGGKEKRGNGEGDMEYSEIKLIKRERNITRAEENRKISEAKYNRRYKEILAERSIQQDIS